MPLEIAFLSQSSFLEAQSLQHWSSPYPLSFLNSLPSGICPHRGSGLRSLVLVACSREQAPAPIFVPTVQPDTVDRSSWEISSAASQLSLFLRPLHVDLLQTHFRLSLNVAAPPALPQALSCSFLTLSHTPCLSWVAQHIHSFSSHFMSKCAPQPRPFL